MGQGSTNRCPFESASCDLSSVIFLSFKRPRSHRGHVQVTPIVIAGRFDYLDSSRLWQSIHPEFSELLI
jgi:hypothetical protein